MIAEPPIPLHVPPAMGPTIRIGGARYTFKIDGAATEGAVSIIEGVLEPGHLSMPPHTHHHEDEVTYVLSGELSVLVGTEVTRVRTGGCHMRPRGLVHTYWNQGVVPARFLKVVVPSGSESFLREAAETLAAEPRSLDGLAAVAARHGVELHLDQLGPLLGQYHLRF